MVVRSTLTSLFLKLEKEMILLSEDGVIRYCGLYSRVSTEDQDREGFSLSEQKARLEAYCNSFGYHIKEYYEVEDYKNNEKISYRYIYEIIKEYVEVELCQDH